MSLANMLSALLASVVLGLAAWHFASGRQRLRPPDNAVRRRRTLVAWEVRGMVVAVTGPCAAGIFFGYLSTEYTLPLLLFVAAGVITAELIEPSDARAHH